MQLHGFIFAAVQAAGCLYAVREGGQPEKIVAGMMAVAALASNAIPVQHAISFTRPEYARFAIDAALMLGLLAVMARADRYWPLYVAAVHFDAVAVHGVKAYDPTIIPIVYSQLTQLAAYPMIALLVLGTWRHHRRRRAGLPERDWSSFSERQYVRREQGTREAPSVGGDR